MQCNANVRDIESQPENINSIHVRQCETSPSKTTDQQDCRDALKWWWQYYVCVAKVGRVPAPLYRHYIDTPLINHNTLSFSLHWHFQIMQHANQKLKIKPAEREGQLSLCFTFSILILINCNEIGFDWLRKKVWLFCGSHSDSDSLDCFAQNCWSRSGAVMSQFGALLRGLNFGGVSPPYHCPGRAAPLLLQFNSLAGVRSLGSLAAARRTLTEQCSGDVTLCTRTHPSHKSKLHYRDRKTVFLNFDCFK